MNINVSLYKNAFSKIPETVGLESLLHGIKNGKFEPAISECRELFQIGDINGYKRRKSDLPAFTVSGVFNGSHKGENLVQYTNLIVIDIDKLNPEEICLLQTKLKSEKSVVSFWRSPSLIGLKIIIAVKSDPTNHKFVFDAICFYLKEKYEIDVDKSGSDICRLCFVSFDPDLWISQDVSAFEMNSESEPLKKTHSLVRASSIKNLLVEEENNFYNPVGRNKGVHSRQIKKIITFLKKNNKSITSNYESWYKVSIAISNTFTYDLGRRYFMELCLLDNDLHDGYKSEYILHYSYRNKRTDSLFTFDLIVEYAKQQGFVILKKK